ncbi:MAG: nucleoside phosphorylase [Caldilineaceae bacterium]|nr:nucleoside phosphorylase [Caldilineaceae bacterium]
MDNSPPILEFDGEPEAILEPRKLIEPLETMPTHGVICFFQDVITHFVNLGLAEEIHALRSEIGRHPIYVHQVQGQRVALFHPGIGAPLAAAMLEEVIALGCRNFIACGGAGVLNRELAMGHLVVPNAAVRDEGTSYHYLIPDRLAAPSPAAVMAIEQVLQQRKVDYVVGKTWTTDAIYRETRARMALRRGEGCITVEMEAAALFAVAQFRGVHLGQILYCGDNLDGDEWDGREWTKNWGVREILATLAAEAALAIDPGAS